jgi:rhodanese-related sulfurtransferase
MPSPNTISVDKLSRLIGRPDSPALIDVCTEEDFAAHPRLVPGAVRRPWADVPAWGPQFVAADALKGGAAAWAEAKLPMVPAGKLPKRDGRGRTAWVTRARPKVDRIACPWLIRRFVDPQAVFLFVVPADRPGVHWSHRGEKCTFDVMIEEFGLLTAALQRLATIVRGADTGRPGLAPESAGLLAASLGSSRKKS